MNTPSTTSRRNLFLGVGGLAVIAAGWQVFGVGRSQLSFAPLAGLDGWQVAQTNAITSLGGSATSSPLIGIGDASVRPMSREALCRTLYRNTEGGVPIAVFSDFFCPNCRTLEARLAERDDLAITWHQLPLLGPSSQIVAQALVAADRQGGYEAMRDRLLARPFRPMLQTFLEAAIEAGLDAEALGHEMYRSKVEQQLLASKSAAETLGVWGTPAFTIGQTLVLGAVTVDQIDQLIDVAGGTTCT